MTASPSRHLRDNPPPSRRPELAKNTTEVSVCIQLLAAKTCSQSAVNLYFSLMGDVLTTSNHRVLLPRSAIVEDKLPFSCLDEPHHLTFKALGRDNLEAPILFQRVSGAQALLISELRYSY